MGNTRLKNVHNLWHNISGSERLFSHQKTGWDFTGISSISVWLSHIKIFGEIGKKALEIGIDIICRYIHKFIFVELCDKSDTKSNRFIGVELNSLKV